MAYKQKINPRTGKFDMVSPNEGGGYDSITSSDQSVTVTQTLDGYDLQVSAVKMLAGYHVGARSSGGLRKFADLFWCNNTGSVSHHYYFHVNYLYLTSGGSAYYTCDVSFVWGNIISQQVCDAIVMHETVTVEGTISESDLERFRPSKMIKIDIISWATRISPYASDPRIADSSVGLGHAAVVIDFPTAIPGALAFNPISSLAIKENLGNVVWFFLNPDLNGGNTPPYTAAGDLIPAVISAEGSEKVQSDYAQSDSTDPSYIRNKPYFTSTGESISITMSGQNVNFEVLSMTAEEINVCTKYTEYGTR